MLARRHLLLVIPALTLSAVLWMLGGATAISITWLRVVVWAATVGVLAWAVFDLRLWRFAPIHKAWVEKPDMHGTWRATLRSNWEDPTTGKTIEAIEGYMVVEQTFGSLRMRLLTTESSSDVLGVSILDSGHDRYRVAAIYRNDPRRDGRTHAETHVGTLLLEVPGRKPAKLAGRYSTDRDTQGEILLTDRKRRIISSFREGTRIFHRAA